MTTIFFVLNGLRDGKTGAPAVRPDASALADCTQLLDGWYWLPPHSDDPSDGPHKCREDAERAATYRTRSWALPFQTPEEPYEIDPEDERTPDDTNLATSTVDENGVTTVVLEGSYSHYEFRSSMDTERCVRALWKIVNDDDFQE